MLKIVFSLPGSTTAHVVVLPFLLCVCVCFNDISKNDRDDMTDNGKSIMFNRHYHSDHQEQQNTGVAGDAVFRGSCVHPKVDDRPCFSCCVCVPCFFVF